ncbi:hypothetical protein JXD38_00835 [candidate division WOR-3 bacterium]|nr:hypothetical protein [candidate division WOR-3 bacterium]
MSDAIRRIERWQKKYSPERTKATLELLQDEMRQRYAAVTTEMTAMELQVKEVLNQMGVHTTNYVPYLSYARQLWKLGRQQNISGESFAMASEVLLQKWAGRGQDPDVLAAIRTKVFNSPPPKP